jgi:hypothetical protein
MGASCAGAPTQKGRARQNGVVDVCQPTTLLALAVALRHEAQIEPFQLDTDSA